MATDLERLLVKLEADISKYERNLAKATGVAERQARQIEKSFRGIEDGVGKALSTAAARFSGLLVGALSVNEIRQWSDAFIRTQNALKVAGLEGENLKSTYADLFAIAQRQGTSIESTAQLYGKLAAVQKDLNATNPELLRFTEGVGQALKVAGTDAEQASGALLQLGQALGGGKIQAEEFNSILDGARPILQTVANGLVEAGGSVSKLKAIVADGQLSAEAFFRAFLAGAPQLAAQAQQAGQTSSQAFEQLKNSMINLIGVLDQATGASAGLASGITSVAGAFDAVAKALPGAIQKLREFFNVYNQGVALGAQAGKVIGDLANPNGFATGGGFGTETVGGAEERIGAGLGRLPAPIVPVSLKSFPVTGGGGSGGGGGKSTVDEVKKFADEINKTIDPTIEFNRQLDLLFKAMDRGLISAEDLGEAVKIITERVSEAGASAAKGKDDLEKMFKGVESAVQSVGSKLGDTLGELVTGGKVDFKDLANSIIKDLVRITTQILIMQPIVEGLKNAFKGGGSGSSGGGLGGILSSLFNFGGARAAGGPVSPGSAYLVGERGPELFAPTRAGAIIPNKGLAGGGLSIVINNNAPGVSHTASERIDRNGIREIVVEAVLDDVRRNGNLGRMLAGAGVNRFNGR